MDPFEDFLTGITARAEHQARVTPLPDREHAAARIVVRGVRILIQAAAQAGRDTVPIEVLDRMVTGVHDRMIPATTSQEAAS